MGDASRLKPIAREYLTEAQAEGLLFVSAISVLEISRLCEDGLLDIGMSIDRFVEEAEEHGGVKLLPLTNRILIESTRLPGTIHRDPSDRLLVATAREHGLTLLTRDRDILKYAQLGHLNARKL